MRFSGLVNADGNLKLDNREEFKDQLCKLRGKRVRVSVEAEGFRRSDPQNRRFFGVIVPVCREVLNQELQKRGSMLILTKEETHEYLDRTYLGEEETDVGRF